MEFPRQAVITISNCQIPVGYELQIARIPTAGLYAL